MGKSVKQIIQEHYNDLSASNQKIAKFVIDNYQQSMLMGSVELARASGVSNTAVIRFAKALGFSGFIEYKNTLKQEHISTQRVYTYLNLMESSGKGENRVSRYLSALANDFERFTTAFDQKAVDSFCNAILQAKKVYLMGVGSDIVVAVFLQNYLNVMGVSCSLVTQEGLTLREHLFQINSGDVLFLSAFPTTVNDERWAAAYAKKQQAKILVMTDSEVTARELKADSFVCLSESQDVFFNSYFLPMAFCNALLLRLYELAPDHTAQAMKAYEEMLRNSEL